MAARVGISMPGIFHEQADRYGGRPCVLHKENGAYKPLSWKQLKTMVRDFGSFMLARGIDRGDKVAIFSPNRYEWWIADLATLSAGGVDVPVYSTNSAEEAFYILEHSRCRMCFAGGKEQLEKILEISDRLPMLETVVSFDSNGTESPGIVQFQEALSEGRQAERYDSLEKRLKSTGENDLATIIYTSGTTGPPKGVMLSHKNFVSNVNQIMTDFAGLLSPEDLFLSFLPLSHALERTAGFYLPIKMGATVAFAESFHTIQENLQETKPSIIVSVPRLYEKIHAGIKSKVKSAALTRRALFNWAMKCAAQNLACVCAGKDRKGLFALRYRVAERLIFSRLKAALGMERLKFAVSGGGPLSVPDAEFFLGMGIVILEGFGLTETSPVTHVNRPGSIKPGSVGTPLVDTEVRIDSDGQLLIRGPQVMLGYYRDDEATKSVFTEDGFLKTGDIGTIDEEGRLTITGRIKEIIITSGGKNISPQNMENSLKVSRFIEQASIIGDKRRYLTTLIVPSFEELEKWAFANGIETASKERLVKDERVRAFYGTEIADCLKGFSRSEQIREFRLLPDEWTQQTGELTPTLKLKRRVIEKKYAETIEEMYPPET